MNPQVGMLMPKPAYNCTCGHELDDHRVAWDGAISACARGGCPCANYRPAEKPAANKYHAERTIVDGIVFASRKEAVRYQELRLLEQAGEIRELRCQVRHRVEINGQHICDYVSDFEYEEQAENPRRMAWVVEDVKSPATRRNPVYALKRKLMLATRGIAIRET